jgi:NAD(P)-dependent dehydrogenase (short-subunit alcohol dehydrogenase family)
MPNWTDKVVLVTGGSAGLGLAIARAFAAARAQVMIAGRSETRLRSAAESIAGERRCSWHVADVTRQGDCESLVASAVSKAGRLDVLVNCAGRSTRGAIESTTAEDFTQHLDVNFLSAVRMTQLALPHLLASRGHVVQIGSLAAKAAGKFLGAYPASKFPLAAYAQQLRLEMGPQGLHTLLVCPGPLRREDAGQRYADEARHLPAEAAEPGGGVKLPGIDADWLASRIVRACELRQAELVVPARAKLLFALAQLWPALGDWIINRMTR